MKFKIHCLCYASYILSIQQTHMNNGYCIGAQSQYRTFPSFQEVLWDSTSNSLGNSGKPHNLYSWVSRKSINTWYIYWLQGYQPWSVIKFCLVKSLISIWSSQPYFVCQSIDSINQFSSCTYKLSHTGWDWRISLSYKSLWRYTLKRVSLESHIFICFC